MIFSPPLIEARLVRRYKRFLSDVALPSGESLTVHCPNSGSMRGCLEPDARAWISDSENPKRKLRYSLEIVEASGALCMVNTHRPNALVEEAVSAGRVPALAGYERLRREVRYGEGSRIDLLLDDGEGGGLCYVEIKSVTMGVGDGVARFPDAVTSRGQKHLRELATVAAAGHRAVLFFSVNRDDTRLVEPADDIDPVYGALLREVASAGVEIMAWRSHVSPVELRLEQPIPVRL